VDAAVAGTNSGLPAARYTTSTDTTSPGGRGAGLTSRMDLRSALSETRDGAFEMLVA